MSNINPYIKDIASQPEMLEGMLKQLRIDELALVRKMLQQEEFDRIVITGMGASLFGSYPASLLLANAGIPTIWIDNAELLHYAPGLITSRTLLWMVSQSGQSAEAVSLLEPDRTTKPKLLISITNDQTNQLAKASQVVMQISAPAEASVSTRTYLNTLAISQLTAQYLIGKDIQPSIDELHSATQSIHTYVQAMDEHIQTFIQQVGIPQNLVILGRGTSMAAAWYGALVLGEASKLPAFALNAAEFRHGPMEMLNPSLIILTLSGARETAELNRRLLREINAHGSRGFWIDSQPDNELNNLPMPKGTGVALPIVETLPFQVLTLAIAQQSGVEAGKFLYSGKVTTQE